jgi:type I restriction enzyme S subunit
MEGWITKSISEVILKTKTIDPRKSPEKEFKYVDVSGVSNQTLEITESTKLAGKNAPSRARRVITEGDIIFATVRPTLRRIAVVPSHLDGEVCSTGYFVFQPNSELYNRYLYYFLQSDNFMGEMEKLQKGASYPAVNDSQVKSRLISYPSVPEQKCIVALLDTVFADLEKTRAKTEQNLKNSRELFDSYLQQVFSQKGEGWAEKTLKEASLDFGRGKSKHRPRNDVSLYGGEYPFVQTGDVRNSEHLITKYSKTYNEVGLEQSKLWPKGTICITIAANIAETGILDFDSCFPDSVIGVVVNPEVTTIPYVEFLLQSFKAILQAKSKGSAQANINMGTFEKLHFPFPNINKQNEIVDSLNELMLSVQQLEVIYQKKLNSIDELKKSILQKAFSGELTASAE